MPVKAVLMPTGEEPQEEAKESPEEKVEEVVKKPRAVSYTHLRAHET